MNNLDSEIQTVDEKRQMKNLANAIKLADSFSLLFVRCNQRPRQKEIIEELKAQLDGYKIKVILLENQVEHLLDELQERLGNEKPDAIFVYGLESSFPRADEAAKSKFVVTLNHSRNSFKKVLHCPLVLLLPEYALSAIYHGATDFYSIRSGVYLFSAKGEEIEQQVSHHTSQRHRESSGLLFEERQNKIRTVEELLSEYQSLPDSQRNLGKEYRLKRRLGDLYDISAEFDKAGNLYKEVIEYSRKSDDLVLLMNSLNDLGLVYKEKKRYNEAIELFKESSVIAKDIIGTNHPEYAGYLNNLALIYDAQRKYDKAIDLYKEALKIAGETTGTKHPVFATSLNNLASIYNSQGRYDEAINLFKEALKIIKEIIGSNHPEYANSLSNLAGVYYDQEKYREALNLMKEAYQINLKTLGANHPQTKNIKNGTEVFQAKIKEKANLLVPYKN